MSYQKVILLVTVLGLYIPHVNLRKLDSNSDLDPSKMSGTWYVGSASIWKPAYRDVQSWTVVISEASPGVYSGVSTEVNKTTCKIEKQLFNLRELRQDGELTGFHFYGKVPDVRLEYDAKFEMIGDAIVLIPNDKTKAPYKYLVLGRDVKSAQQVPRAYELDPDFFLIDHTRCMNYRIKIPSDVYRGITPSLHAASISFLFLFLFCFFSSTYI